MSIAGRIVQGTAVYLLAHGAIKIISKNYGQVRDKVKARVADRGPVAGEDIEVASGHHGLKFKTMAELPRRIKLKYGDLTLDLAGVPVTQDGEVTVAVSSGALRLKLPNNQNWVVAWSVKRGTFLSGQERRFGTKLVGRNANTPLPGEPTLTLTVEQTNGLIVLA
jgi:hypothetical protein